MADVQRDCHPEGGGDQQRDERGVHGAEDERSDVLKKVVASGHLLGIAEDARTTLHHEERRHTGEDDQDVDARRLGQAGEDAVAQATDRRAEAVRASGGGVEERHGVIRTDINLSGNNWSWNKDFGMGVQHRGRTPIPT